MRIVALLAVRNEAVYLARCLEHLAAQGVETCLIDNGSTDATRDIAEAYRDRGVMRIVDHPYPGHYDWTGLLRLKEHLAVTIAADWLIHHDADEIREAPAPWRTLAEGFAAVDRAGYNAVNFDEFVFVPTREQDDFEGTDFVAAMQYYYFFEPRSLHHVKAWKNTGARVDLVSEAGHRVAFPGLRIAPQSFVLRHYIVLSRAHCLRKYRDQREYSRTEVEELRWHGWRAHMRDELIRLPAASEMKRIGDGVWDRSDPARAHRFLVESA
jgi:glycosyltransferase involved in cell wall biosynthesis